MIKDDRKALHKKTRCRQAVAWASAATALTIAIASCGIDWTPASSRVQPAAQSTYIIRVEREHWPESERRALFDAWIEVARSMGYEPLLIVQ